MQIQRPERGFVPDEETAVAIANAILFPIYKQRNMIGKRRQVFLKKDIWEITGIRSAMQMGGSPHVEIDRVTGTILSVSHSR